MEKCYNKQKIKAEIDIRNTENEPNLLLELKEKINCQTLKDKCRSLYKQNKITITNNQISTMKKTQEIIPNIKHKDSTLEVHGNSTVFDKMVLDIRTYICAQGLCTLHYNRTHRRMSNYNWIKIKREPNYINTLQQTTDEIIKLLTLNTNNNQGLYKNCLYCQDIKLNKIKHVHFIKGKSNTMETYNNYKGRKFEPIENIFTKISKIAEINNADTFYKTQFSNTQKSNIKTNSYRMTYGDINYIGNNKAILYFDRGHRGKQIFTNSMHSPQLQSKYDDIIILDEIVFKSPCNCDSSNQHETMFPHYRVTCAKGLTCPARLTSEEKRLYIINKNASTENFDSAKQRLIRYW